MATVHDLMAEMVNHCGKDKGINAKELATKLNVNDRALRLLVTAARENSVAICALPATGYFVAKDRAELEETVEFLKHRAMHSLTLASTLSKLPMQDLIGQLHLRT